MSDKAQAPQYVVTVLRDRQPIAVIDISRIHAQELEVSVCYPDVNELPNIATALEEALGGVEFIHWQNGGPIPAPSMGRPTLTGEQQDVSPF